MTLSTDLSWLKTHAILLLLVVGLSLGGIYEIEHLVAKHDAANAATAESTLRTVTDQVATLQTALKNDEATFQQVNSAQLALISQINLRMSTRDAATKTVVAADASLSALQTAQKMQTDLGPSSEITAQVDSVTMDLSSARVVLERLDTLPAVQSDLSDTQAQLAAEEKIASDNAADAAQQKILIAAMANQTTDTQKACTDQIAAIKAANRNSNLKWFGVGLVLGFIGGILK